MTTQPTTTPIEDAIAALYAAGRPGLAAAVQYAADHQDPATATTWTDGDGETYPLDHVLISNSGVEWTCIGWLHPLPGADGEPVPLMSDLDDDEPWRDTLRNVIENDGPVTVGPAGIVGTMTIDDFPPASESELPADLIAWRDAAVKDAAGHQADPDEPETARLTADVVLFGGPADNLHVLLIKRGWDPYEGHWALPGGHIDPGETPLAAACRELAEETGLHIRPADLRLVNVYADPGRDPRGRYATWVYTLTLTHQPPPTAGDDAEAAQWVPLDRALSAESRLAFDHERIIREAARVTAPAESLRP